MSDCEMIFRCYFLMHIWMLLIVLIPTLSGHTWNRGAKTDRVDHDLAPSPMFDDIVIKEIEAKVGQTVLLPCTVKNLGDKVVSCIRTKDLHILTSGAHTFSADSRFESVYSANRDFWGLRIRGARVADTGQYECQVNTDPKMSLAINLTVTVSGVRDLQSPFTKYSYRASIKGPKEVYIHEGDPVTFICEVSPLSMAMNLESSAHGYFFPIKPRVRWHHEQRELSLETIRGGISVDTDYMDRKVTSRLRVSMATKGDAGTYTCSQAATHPDSVKLVVYEAEHSEAMQRDFPAHSSGHFQRKELTLLFYFATYCVRQYL